MGTFNFLQKALKESINVNQCDRRTAQRVVFCNNGNVFYGTFVGKMVANDANISGGIIRNVDLSGIRVYDSDGNLIDLSKFGDTFAEICATVDGINDSLSNTASVLSGLSSEVYNPDRSFGSINVSGYSEINSLSVHCLSVGNELICSKELKVKIPPNGDVSSIYDISVDLDRKIDNVGEKFGDTFAAISSLDEKSTVYIEGEKSDLNIRKLSFPEYAELVRNESTETSVVYLISSDFFNMFGERVINVGNAVDDTDAVNLGQVKSLLSTLRQEIGQ